MDPADRQLAAARNLFDLRRYVDAASAVREGLAVAPDSVDLLVLAAMIELAEDRLDEARDFADQAMARETSVATLHLSSRIHRQAGHVDEAIADIDAALTIDATQALLHISRSLAFANPWLDRGAEGDEHDRAVETAEAIASATEAVRLAPDSERAHFSLAAAHLAARALPEAAASLERALGLAPDWPAAHSLMATVRIRQGMVRLASRHLAKAGQLDPSDGRALERLRALGGRRRRRWSRRRQDTSAWLLSAEARSVLYADRSMPEVDGS